MIGKALTNHLQVPVGNRNLIWLGRDVIPQRLNIVDLGIERQIAETCRRKRKIGGHEVCLWFLSMVSVGKDWIVFPWLNPVERCARMIEEAS